MSRNEALQFVNVAHFFDHYFLLIFPTAALAIAPAWNEHYADVLLLGSPLYFMFALGTLPAGWLGDRMDRLMLIAVFFVGCGLSSLWIGVSDSATSLGIGLGSLGLFAAIYHPVGLAHVTDIGLRTGRALAINGIFGNMGLAGATVITGLIVTWFGWQAAFLIPGTISTFIGLALLMRIRRRRPPVRFDAVPQKSAGVPLHPSRDQQIRVFLVVCVAALLGGLIFNAITISLPKFFAERLVDASGDIAWIGASAGLVFAVAAFAQLPSGELLDRIGARPVLLTLLGLQCVFLLLLTNATGFSALALALGLVTLIFAGIPVNTWLLGHYLESGIRSRAVSVEYVLSLGIGSVVVPVIAFLQGKGFGFDRQFVALAVAALGCLTVALLLPGGVVVQRASPASSR